MRLVLLVACLLAVGQLAQASLESESLALATSLPKWIKPESKFWPRWGAIHLKWLNRELQESQRDYADAKKEIGVVRSWAAGYVRHREGEVNLRLRNRNEECSSFNGLVNIRKGNFLFHNAIHQRLTTINKYHANGDKYRQKLIKKYGPVKGPEMYKRRHKRRYEKWMAQRELYYRQKFNAKFSSHARMLIASRDRFNAAKRAYNNCRVSIARLTKRKIDIVKVAKQTAAAAVLRAKAHVKRAHDRVKKIQAKIAKLLKAMDDRLKKSKIHYFHRCRRVGAYKYKCFFSVVHGGSAFARQPHRFFKCIWAGANKAVVRYTCYK